MPARKKRAAKQTPQTGSVFPSERAANPLEVAALLREAARRTLIEPRYHNPKRDRDLLKAARAAQHEGGSFTEMFNTVTTVNGAIEVLYQMIQPRGDVPEEVNWTCVADLLDDCRRRLGSVYCALHQLESFERKQEAVAHV